MALDPKGRYVQKKSDGYIYPWTEAIAERMPDEFREYTPTREECGLDPEVMAEDATGPVPPAEEVVAPVVEEPTAPAPEDDTNLMTELKLAIAKLPADSTGYTGAGIPRTEALASALGVDVITAAQRDKAWALYLEENK